MDTSLVQAPATTKKVVFSIIMLVALLAAATILLTKQQNGQQNPGEAFSNAINIVLHLGIPSDAQDSGLLVLISIAGAVITVYLTLIFVRAVYTDAMKKSVQEAKLVKKINELSNHYVICGGGSLGFSVGKALVKRGRAAVVIDS